MVHKKVKPTGTVNIPLHKTFIRYSLGTGEPRFHKYEEMGNNPHYHLWNIILNYFKKRGFEVGPEPRVDKLIANDFKYGKKGDLEFSSHRYPNGFEFEFYQNVYFKNPNGGRFDFDKYQMMPYLIKLSYRNEMIRLGKYLEKRGINVTIQKQLSPIDNFLKNKMSNGHFRHTIQSVEEIGQYMNDYDKNHNSTDRNNQLFQCGDTKCIYSYGDGLVEGKVYHNLGGNWVLIRNGKTWYTTHNSLFDYYHGIPMKKPLSHSAQIQRFHSELKKAEEGMNYERCIVLRNLLKNYQLYNIWSLKHGAWWGPNDAGYTNERSRAGVYTHEAISNKKNYYNDGVNCIAKPLNA
jgi:hypothetical protein